MVDEAHRFVSQLFVTFLFKSASIENVWKAIII